MNPLYTTPTLSLYANDNAAMVPEIWTNMGLAILEENMVMASLVHRDFSPEVARFGDVVNTRRPGQFKLRRKSDTDLVEGQDAITNNVRVPLDQWFYQHFTIYDGEASKSFQDLIDTHLLPAMQAMARSIDRALLGRVHDYLVNKVGKLEGLSGANARDTILDAREKMNVNKAFFNGRHLVVSPNSETQLLKANNDLFLAANKKGDEGTALREASLGRLLGFDFWMDQNVPATREVDLDVEVDWVTTAAYDKGDAGPINIDGGATAPVVGEYVVIDGDNQPTAATVVAAGAGSDYDVTLDADLTDDVASGAKVTIYKACQTVAAYTADRNKEIVVTGFTTAPLVGQIVAIGTGASRRVYTVIESEADGGNQKLLLDRPLELDVASGADVFPGPGGSYNLAFHREALTLVSRPLALPAADLGVRSSVGVHNDVSMRVAMQYDIKAQGTVVTLDMLCGTQVLDTDLACVMLG